MIVCLLLVEKGTFGGPDNGFHAAFSLVRMYVMDFTLLFLRTKVCISGFKYCSYVEDYLEQLLDYKGYI